MTDDDERTPASPAGLARLATIVAERFGRCRVAVDGVGTADGVRALGEAGLDAQPLTGDTGQVDVVVSLGERDADSVQDARRHVERLTAIAGAVVFSQAGDPLRFPSWWDELFASAGFDALDVLRAQLWDDDEWDAATLSILTLYVRRSELPSADDERPSAIPRSAVHPGVFVAAQRVATGARRLAKELRPGTASLDDPIAAITRAVSEHDDAVDAARAELVAEREQLGELRAAAVESVELAEADVASARADAAEERSGRLRAEAIQERAEWELEALRDERDAVVAAAAAAPMALPSPSSELIRRGAAAAGRRVRRRALSAADRLGALPGVAGRVSRRSLTAYRTMTTDWREATRAVFDTDFYLAQRPGLVGSGIDPVVHYASVGWREGLDPHPLFDTDWYHRTNPTLLTIDVSPLEHYLAMGWREGCDPHPLFDTDFYLRRSKDVAVRGVNALVHYLDEGWRQGRDPHPLFETNRYLDRYPDVREHGVCPLIHYVVVGWQENRSPGELFDAVWYTERHTESLASGLPPYRYYLEVGVRRGDVPSPWAARIAASTDEAEHSDGDRAFV